MSVLICLYQQELYTHNLKYALETRIIYAKLFPQQAVEAHRVVELSGSHIV
jgi:hypothetical protein